MPPKKQAPHDTFWRKASYVAAQDINAVAIYRVVTGLITIALIPVIGYIGNRMIVANDQLRADVTAMRTELSLARADIAGQKATIDMANLRVNRLIDRIGADEIRLAQLEGRVEFILAPPRAR